MEEVMDCLEENPTEFVVVYMDTGSDISRLDKHDDLNTLLTDVFGDLIVPQSVLKSLASDSWTGGSINEFIDAGYRVLLLANEDTGLAYGLYDFCGGHEILTTEYIDTLPDSSRKIDGLEIYGNNYFLRSYQAELRYISLSDEGVLTEEFETFLNSSNIDNFYVRQQQQDARQSSAGEDSVASLVDAPQTQPAPPAISRTSLSALARFLSLEIQHPLKTNQDNLSRTGFTTLKSLLRRLEISLDSEQDFELLSWQLVSILTQIESPDAVCNVVDQISECVASLQSARDGEEMDVDSASSALVRTSLLGVFVRSFLLEMNRLLFDGLSRLFDDVQQYLEQFREDVEKEKKMEKEEEKDSSLELLGSPASQNIWNEGKMDDDELLLSPIHAGSATPSHNTRESNLMTPAATKLDPQVLAEKLLTPEAVREANDPAVWSTDQLNYILSDMIRDMEGGRRTGNSQQPEGQSTEEQLLLLRKKMDGSDPNVLFASTMTFSRRVEILVRLVVMVMAVVPRRQEVLACIFEEVASSMPH
ncbi:hypothetical protein JG687_00009648 [Phytophthora cactorum]|uniref:Uncharacterized protein n=1 Tax=Phytophthora cactorum TaxID=29920 RepID=A0A8T1U918_9STRA|nr:hypothetical protein JG687_00009648 [Phytophthora cactorum]